MDKDYKRKNRIDEALNLRGMRQSELCERTGLKKSSVNGYIKQNWQPKQEALYKMSKVLNVSEMWLAGYDVEMSPNNYNNDIILEYVKKLNNLSPDKLALVTELIDTIGGE